MTELLEQIQHGCEAETVRDRRQLLIAIEKTKRVMAALRAELAELDAKHLPVRTVDTRSSQVAAFNDAETPANGRDYDLDPFDMAEAGPTASAW